MAGAAREPEREQARMVRFGHARWDRAGRRLTVRGEAVKLSWKTAECLNLLVEARGEVVPKEDLLREVWGAGLVEESNLAQCISVLRKSLDPAPDGGSHIGTAARVGYRLAVDVEEEAAAAVVVAEAGGVKRGRYPRIVWALGCVALLTVMAGGGEAYRRMERRERADELLERARTLMRRSTLTEAEKAPGLIQEAIDLVPGYAPAQAAFAEASARLGKTTFEASVELARLAVRNDPECGECRAVLGYVLGTRGWRWKEAGEHLARAVALDGNRLHWRLWYADWLAAQGRLDEAAAQAGEAKRIDPTEPRVYSAMASVRFLRGDYRGAIQEGEKATALNRQFQPGHYWMYRSYLQLGEDASAIVARAFEVTSWAGDPEAARRRFHDQFFPVYEKEGRRGLGRAWMHEVREGSPLAVHRYNRAIWSMWIGEREQALEELEAAVATKPYHLIYVAVDPVFAPLRGEARFQEVVRRVGLRVKG